MKKKNLFHTGLGIVLIAALTFFTSCERDLDVLEPADHPNTPEVFIDGFSAGLNYAAFGGSKVTAFDVDNDVKFSGTASMRFEVPDFEDPQGAYAGGTYFTDVGRDLSGYDALTFWAKASKAATIDIVGFGNDAAELKYVTSIIGLDVNTNWKKYYIPIPDPSLLISERGMFYYSEGPEDGRGYTFWIDEVKFEKLGTVAHQRPAIMEAEDQVADAAIGDELTINGTFTLFNLPSGIDQRLDIGPSHYTFYSSDSTIATVSELGIVSVRDSGDVVITASLAGIDAEGSLTVNAVGALPRPSTPAPTPAVAADSVISMFSNAYTNVPVDTWNPFWEFSTTLLEDLQIDGNDVKLYTKLNFVGIEFLSQTIDASEMTHLSLDIWTPDPTDPPAAFNVLLVDVGPDGVIGGEDNSSHEVSITSPTLKSGEWVTLDIPLSDFTGLTSRAQLGQLVLSGDPNTVYVDNVYFYNSGSEGGSSGGEPTEAAPIPTQDAADVISVFSDSYTDIEGTNLNPDWGQETVAAEISIAGNNTLSYIGLNYQGIELGSSQDVSGMEYLHLDFWTGNSSALNVYLISNGSVETAYALSVPTDGWASVDIPLSSFSPVDLAEIIQLKFDGNGNIYLDNIYFYTTGGGGSPTEPTQPAPTPIQNASNVVSIFSDSYTDVDGTDFFPDWGQTTVVTTEDIQGNAALKYTGFNYQGIQLTGSQDLSDMDYLHIDMWTVDATVVKVTPINNSGSPMEFLVSMTPIVAGVWNSYDIPLTEFTNSGMSLNEIIQIKFDGQEGTSPSNIYLDNIYFYNEGGGGSPTEPTQPAPTPTADAANVISVFSDSFSNIADTELNPSWGQATVVSEVSVGGNNTLLYSGLDFQGIQLGSSQNVTGMETLHLDLWTANSTALNIYLISTGPIETAYSLTVPTSGWASVDIPLSSFSPVDLSDVIQFKFDGNGDIYMDNIYFYTTGGGGGNPTEPTNPADAPSFDAINVVSLFSNAYTNVGVDTWSAEWDVADLEDIQIAGDDVKLYTNLSYAGIESTSQTIDASEMTHFYVNIWTPDPSDTPAAFKVKLVDFGADGGYQGGDDVEHELTFNASSTPAIATGSWVSLNIPLADFTGLTTKANIAQIIISGEINTVYVDNMLFHK